MTKKKPNAVVGAPKDNKNRIALKEADVRQDAYRDYCEHLAKGKGKRGWVYEKNGLTCTWETMEKYIKDSIEFDPTHKKVAESKGYETWENVVMDSAQGKNKDANTASLQMLMRNKYGWDKPDQVDERQNANALSAVEGFVVQLKEYRLGRAQSQAPIIVDNHND